MGSCSQDITALTLLTMNVKACLLCFLVLTPAVFTFNVPVVAKRSSSETEARQFHDEPIINYGIWGFIAGLIDYGIRNAGTAAPTTSTTTTTTAAPRFRNKHKKNKDKKDKKEKQQRRKLKKAAEEAMKEEIEAVVVEESVPVEVVENVEEVAADSKQTKSCHTTHYYHKLSAATPKQ